MSSPDDNLTGLQDDEASQKLKLLVASLKKKYGETVTQAYNLDARCRELTAENSTLKQTQTVLTQKFNQTLVELHTLQENKQKSEKECEEAKNLAKDAEQEIAALRDQHAYLKNFITEHEDEAKKAIDELQAIKLKEIQLERVIQFLRKRSEEAHLETNQIAQELAHAQEVSQNLTEELSKTNHLVRELKDSLAKDREEKKLLEEETEHLREQLKNLTSDFSSLKREIESITEQNRSLSLEYGSTKSSYEALQNEHLLVKQMMMKGLEETKQDLLSQQKTHEDKLLKMEESYLEKAKDYEKEIHTLQIQLNQFNEREGEVQRTLEMKALLDKERLQLKLDQDEQRDKVANLEAEKLDLDQKLRTAQQHLAKKVREMTLVNERSETEKIKNQELQTHLNQAQIKISELKNSLEIEVEHHKRHLQREAELLKNSESQVQKLEEKYFQMHEKWREAAGELRELKQMEEKFREMQSLFSNVGSFLSPAKKIIPTEMVSDPVEVKEPKPEEFASLFEMPKSRFKDSFL